MNQFTDKDLEKYAEFLNIVATNAVFKDLAIKDIIKVYGFLVFMQKDLYNKIEQNILEVKKFVPPPTPPEEAPVKKSKK
jgi:hypothetical protein